MFAPIIGTVILVHTSAPINGVVTHELAKLGVQTVHQSAFEDRRAELSKLGWVEEDRLVYPAQYVAWRGPNDQHYRDAWHHIKIQSNQCFWRHLTMRTYYPLGDGITIAICDSGVGPNDDLTNQMVPGWNLYDNSPDTLDVTGHGTMVAGCAAAESNNEIGVTSIAWNSKIMPMRVSEPNGSAYLSRIAQGIIWASDHGARVANVSFMASTSITLAAAGQYMQGRGGIVVVATGNNGQFVSNPDSPYLLVVSGTDQADNLTGFSTYGNNVDVSAPAVSIWTTTRSNTYAAGTGTSFCAPLVCGVVADMMATYPLADPIWIEDRLEQHGVVDLGAPGWDSRFGWGRVDLYRALTGISLR